jgi:hypothetical protein
MVKNSAWGNDKVATKKLKIIESTIPVNPTKKTKTRRKTKLKIKPMMM